MPDFTALTDIPLAELHADPAAAAIVARLVPGANNAPVFTVSAFNSYI